jgi:hypothetical protein
VAYPADGVDAPIGVAENNLPSPPPNYNLAIFIFMKKLFLKAAPALYLKF